MLYIHQSSCISPQPNFPATANDARNTPGNNRLSVIEPAYEEIPRGMLRRMSKPVRMGMGAALPLLKTIDAPDGIIIGTANAGMEDCFYFLRQIIQYNEGLLTPGNFVQSTPNALAAQIGMLKHNTGYNITHVHQGLAFENALTDAAMLIEEYPGNSYLLGAVDDISTYQYNISLSDGAYKDETIEEENIYNANTKGNIPGEGAAMFAVSGKAENAIAVLVANDTIHTEDENLVKKSLEEFLAQYLGDNKVDVLISGENGDNRFAKFYFTCEKIINAEAGITRYKHLTGEYPTASSMAVGIACYLLKHGELPAHMIKKPLPSQVKYILIYNNFNGIQHSFILLSAL